ncbi:hypothetical protein [Burkholderia sp. Bp8984]|uniref:hypothetical protein n=1 Tax=Burkholderia sp. Bp8984 TaxID=2184549 RepID=UPI000F5AACFD|nr:hypothetical protein [Burkholderia sp. Bp8984]RQS63838.1 hypothetical protein DID98_02855 [Burkholderia sp. Bp8984]
MTVGTTTALNIIQGALRRINSYQSGEQISAPDEADCLDTLNDLLDSLSTDKQFIFGSQENILNWTAQQRLYKVGNPINSLLNLPNFTGALTAGSNVITGITNMPQQVVAGQNPAYTVGSGSIVTDVQGLLPANTTVTAIGVNSLTLSANAIGNSTGADNFSYTVPGDLPIPRPLRITHGFTRFNALDFTLDVYETETQYTEFLYKAQPGPWPTVAWYNNTFPYGLLNVYQTPGNNAECHLFTDTLLQNLTLSQVLVMPQGYARMLKWLLAKELCAEYGFPLSQAILMNAREATEFVKALNAKPASVSRYDRELVRGNRPDGGWILSGGYR